MAKFIATIKAIITRLVFAAHGILAIWQVTIFKNNTFYWYLSSPILLLFFEGVFTLTIKENQEWKWFCPSVFLYLASVVPPIWLLELDKVDRRLRAKEEPFNLTAAGNLNGINNLMGVDIKLPEISISTETWITLIEQFLMLILIIGRWMLPKGDLTRDQLSQLLLVYIGTAADIIEFFDSFKDDKIAAEPILVLLTLAIWSWSLMQFTVVLTATKARKSRLTATKTPIKPSSSSTSCCCSIDVWGIAINITLQDAPFLVFRLLIIAHFKIISYMNVFFTCKNTLVILLQLYRLYVVHSESHKTTKKKKKSKNDFELTDISIISKPDMYGGRKHHSKKEKHRTRKSGSERRRERHTEDSDSHSEVDEFSEEYKPRRNIRQQNSKKDTGYSTASSHASNKTKLKKNSKSRESSRERPADSKSRSKSKQKLKRSDTKEVYVSSEENESESEEEVVKKPKKEVKKPQKGKKGNKHATVSSSSDPSSD